MSLTDTQRAFATSREPYPAFVGGFGSGKTAAAIARAMALKAHFRQCDIAYYLPSFPLVEDIAMRRFPELCERKGWAHKTRGGTSPHIEFPGAGRILFRSMSTPLSPSSRSCDRRRERSPSFVRRRLSLPRTRLSSPR